MSLNFPAYGGNFGGHHQQHQQVIKSGDYATATPSMLTEMTSKYQVDDGGHDDSKYMSSPEINHGVYLESSSPQNRQYAMMEEDEPSKNNLMRSLDHRSTGNTTASGNSVSWQSLVTPGGVADYLARLPIGLHHLLKLSSDGPREPGQIPNLQPLGKKKSQKGKAQVKQAQLHHQLQLEEEQEEFTSKLPKNKDIEIRLTTALDGSTLFCCPECQMAYPEKELLERHIQNHKLDRKYVCDICGACLKRKDHLTRHKQSHNPDRPYCCTICMKAFKRKEHLNLHFVMHSGEKTHVCPECGKGFYCKDHLDRHKQGHNPDRPFICSVCMKVKTNYFNLNINDISIMKTY